MSNDPATAQVQILALPPGADRNVVRSSVISNLGRRDIPAAMALRQLAGSWAQDDPRAAVEWVLQNDPPTKNYNTLSSPFFQWISAAPDEALDWALTKLPAGAARDELSGNVVAQLANNDPKRALAIAPPKR